MSKVNQTKDLLIEQLRDRYDSAKQQADAYVFLLKNATDERLRVLISEDINANKNHLDTLTEILEILDHKFAGERCQATYALISEAYEVFNYTEESSKVMRDAGITLSIQHINHHDIAGFGGCLVAAKAIGDNTLAAKIETMLSDEKNADENLKKLLESLLTQ